MSPQHARASQPFVVHPERPRTLLIGDPAGIGPVVALADRLRAEGVWKPLVLLGSDIPFPFRSRPSDLIVPGIPTWAIACMPLLEQWGVPNRLASTADFPGCFEGRVTELAATWLTSLGPKELGEVEVFACGRETTLDDCEALALRFGVPCQSLPEAAPTLDTTAVT